MQFYSPAYILAPPSITTTAVSLAASHLFYKQLDATAAPTPTSKPHQLSLSAGGVAGGGSGGLGGGTGECASMLPHFVQLTLSNSHYGFLNAQNNYNYNLSELILSQQQLLLGAAASTGAGGGGGVAGGGPASSSSSSLSLLANGVGSASISTGASGISGQLASSVNNW